MLEQESRHRRDALPTLPDSPAATADAAMQRLLRNASIELTTNGRAAIEAAARLLPPGSRVYLPKMPRERLLDKLAPIAILREVGLDPVPHIVARHLSSPDELREFLNRAAAESGVRRVLVIGGDRGSAEGPFADSAAVVGSGMLAAAGITHVDVAGYPDGHPAISTERLTADLALKVRHASAQGLTLGIVTQFGFDPGSIATWCQRTARLAPGIAIHAGLAGPTNASQLLRYARVCGVSTSLKAVGKLGTDAVRLAMNSRPERQLDVLSRFRAAGMAGNLAGVHLFSFGGFVRSAEWMNETLRQIARTAPEMQ